MGMDTQKIAETLTGDEIEVLRALQKSLFLCEVEKVANLPEIKVVRALQWLESKGLCEVKTAEKIVVKLDENGRIYSEKGLPEFRFFEVLEKVKEGEIKEIGKKAGLNDDEVQVSLGLLRKKGAISLEKKGEKLYAKACGKFGRSFESEILGGISKREFIELNQLKPEERLCVDELLKRRKILKIENLKEKSAKLTELGKQILTVKIDSNKIEQITPKIIKSGEWKNKKFRSYDIQAKVPETWGGRRHPLSEAVNTLRKIYLEMGFQEMKGPLVETAFWCMDSMWIPQDHPSRDIQDTYFVGKKGKLPENELVKKIKEVQENGLKESYHGHNQKWNPEVAQELLLRTQTTASTFRKFWFDQIKDADSCKYFSVDTVFRNETRDATHLPEFLQAEGFIMDDNLNLATLMGFIKEFYSRLGINKIRFKPCYNPYTEPSMEAHYYDETMGKWYSLINSGIFRPENTKPYGITKPIIAWGMGASRVAALLSGKPIGEIVGSECDLNWLRNYNIRRRL